MNHGVRESWAHINWDDAIQFAMYAVSRWGVGAEACGFIVSGKVVLCTNQTHVRGRFVFSPDDCARVYGAMEQGTLEGVWHSHPGGNEQPSNLDWNSHPRGVPMYIIVLKPIERAHVMRYDDEDRLDRTFLDVEEMYQG